MAIDASIYTNLRQFQAPDIMESAGKAMNLRSLAMQQQNESMKMKAMQDEAKIQDQVRKTKILGSALDSMSALPAPERAALYPTIRTKLISDGFNETDIPKEYDDGLFKQALYQYQQSKEYLDGAKTKAELAKLQNDPMVNPEDRAIERQLKLSDIAFKKANTAKAYSEASKSKVENNLPPENKEQINKLASSNAGKIAIINAIDSATQLLDDETIPDDQKLMQARQMIKTLNSTQGQDAVGAEEAKRLASLLEFNILNLTNPGPIVGRAPISEFSTQSKLTSRAIKESINQNQKVINDLKTGAPLSVDVPSVESITSKSPKPGTVENGYVFNGGDPSNQKNWKKVK